MKTKIIETGEIKSLAIYDKNGIDYTRDFIGNYGSLTDGSFKYNDDDEVYETTQENFDWWKTVIKNESTLVDLIETVKQDNYDEHFETRIQQILDYAGNDDLEVSAITAIAIIKETFNVN